MTSLYFIFPTTAYWTRKPWWPLPKCWDNILTNPFSDSWTLGLKIARYTYIMKIYREVWSPYLQNDFIFWPKIWMQGIKNAIILLITHQRHISLSCTFFMIHALVLHTFMRTHSLSLTFPVLTTGLRVETHKFPILYPCIPQSKNTALRWHLTATKMVFEMITVIVNFYSIDLTIG